ncbi:MAG: hypothetical protein IJ192_11605 [Clostridia bacterium]|nr:hypothetical protein [Clostridia bacterium]
MSYTKADRVLPEELIEMIQEYADGICLYIPKKKNSRRKWGENTDTLSEIAKRNDMICKDHQSGMSIEMLAEKYFLSEKSIQRIIYHKN